MSKFIDVIRAKAKDKCAKVAFPDSEDIRAIEASAILVKEGLGQPILVGNDTKIKEIAAENNVNLEGVEVINPANSELVPEFADMLFEKRKKKGMTLEQATELVKTPLYFVGLLLETNRIATCVGGNVSSTGDVLRASIHTVGVAPGCSVVSSYFVMVMPDERMLCFADCAVNPDPTAEQLADIAISSARNYAAVTGEESKVAMLSFSTNGSAEHELVEKVQNATKIVKEKATDIPCDGEMQLDAAIVPAIGAKKFPGSEVAGNANVLVFPDLNSGNIGYKLTQRLAGAEAVGPFVQGLAKPYCDLSRGCSTDDMVNVACVCQLMAD